MYKVSANEQVFPLDSIGQCPIGHLVSPLMSTTSMLSAVNNVNAVNNVRCQSRQPRQPRQPRQNTKPRRLRRRLVVRPPAAVSRHAACGGVWREYAACGGGFF